MNDSLSFVVQTDDETGSDRRELLFQKKFWKILENSRKN